MMSGTAAPRRGRISRRARQLAAVHLAKRDLGLDDDTYRDFLERETGRRSAAELDDAALDRLLDKMRRLGWKGGKRDRRTQPIPYEADQERLAAHRAAGAGPQEAMILSLWDELADAGAFRARHARLDTFMARLGKDCAVSHPRFLKPAQAAKVIEALKAWLARTRKGQGGGKDA